jgi:hypothetical protein
MVVLVFIWPETLVSLLICGSFIQSTLPFGEILICHPDDVPDNGYTVPGWDIVKISYE